MLYVLVFVSQVFIMCVHCLAALYATPCLLLLLLLLLLLNPFLVLLSAPTCLCTWCTPINSKPTLLVLHFFTLHSASRKRWVLMRVL
jgi:hypothetical protein